MNAESIDYYSVRMRAAIGGAHEDGGRHLSGAERLVTEDKVDATILELRQRAHSRDVTPDFISITIDRIPCEHIVHTQCLPMTTIAALTPEAARKQAELILGHACVERDVVVAAFDAIKHGFGHDGSTLRGAALIDARSGKRLDKDPCRGVRVSHFDYSEIGRSTVETALASNGLSHFRTREALALATKVIWSGVLAEICWSDEPDYTAGYIATHADGYIRFPNFKPENAIGGRIFFIDTNETDLEHSIDCLEHRCVLIEPPIVVRS